MCGIVGYVGKKNASEIVFDCLKKVDYRGYDSWGIAVVSSPKIHMTKKIGRLPAKNEAMLPKSKSKAWLPAARGPGFFLGNDSEIWSILPFHERR